MEKEQLEIRRFMDYLLFMTENLFHEIYVLLSSLEQRTRSERITQTEITFKGKTKILIKERDLSDKEIKDELYKNNIISVIEYIIKGLDSVNMLEYDNNQVLSLLNTLPHIKAKNDFKKLMNEEENNILVKILIIQNLIKQLKEVGYGKPEKYNQLFFFVVKQSINILKRILEG